MHPADIHAALIKKGLDFEAIAKSLTPTVDPSLVGHVIHGRRRNPEVRRKIAEIVGEPVSRIWPGHRSAA